MRRSAASNCYLENLDHDHEQEIMMDDKLTGIEIGKAYVFRWLNDQELTGVAVHVDGISRWVTLRTKRSALKVPPQDVLREVAPC